MDPISALTTIGSTQDRLAQLLAQRAAIGETPVDVGYPSGGLQKEHIYVLGTVAPGSWAQEWSTSGQGGPAGVDEQFTLTVRFWVLHELVVNEAHIGWSTARDRCLELTGELQMLLREDHTLQGLLQLATIVSGDLYEGQSDQARQAIADVNVACTAYLTTTGGE